MRLTPLDILLASESYDGNNLSFIGEDSATCRSDGIAAHYQCPNSDCQRCYDRDLNEVDESELIIPADLTYHIKGDVVEEVSTTSPTCQEPGSKTLKVKCTVCENEYEITETIDALRHELKVVPAKDATCETPGNIEYYVCQNCEGWFLKDGSC